MRDLPYSNRIEPYLEAIQGSDAFFVADREYGRIINYRQMGTDVFPDPHKALDAHTAYLWGLRRQCRGLIFNLKGDVISPGFEKFMNLNEIEETRIEHVDISRPHVILEKMDGSLVRPIPMQDGTYRLGTKMGITDISLQPEIWVQKRGNYHCFFQDLLANGLVPLMEWCSRQQPIVIDHPQDRLVLLAIRSVATGEYLPLEMMLELAVDYQIDVVKRYPGTITNMRHLVESTKDLRNQEGWVIWFSNGYRLKIKADEYVRIHRAKDALMQEKNLIELMLTEKLDDVKAFLPQEDLARIEVYEREFWQGVQDTAAGWNLNYQTVRKRFGTDRKTFALEWANGFDAHLRSLIFRAWDNPDFDWRLGVLGVIGKNLSSQTRVDETRYLHGAGPWRMQQRVDNE
jgi:RNA ligase